MDQIEKFITNLRNESDVEFNIADCQCGKEDFEGWKKRFCTSLTSILRIDERPGEQIISELPLTEIDSVKVSVLKYSFLGLECPCYVLEGKERKGALIALTGHGHGIRNIFGGEYRDEYTHSFALEAAKRGMVVYYPELLGFGFLRLPSDVQTGPGASSCERLSSSLLASRRTLLGMRVMQAMAVIEIIEKTNPSLGISVMGISGGGTVASFLSALEGKRLSSAVISGYAGSWDDSIFAMRHCVCNYVPGMAKSLTLETLLSSIAPLPMLWESGKNDAIFPQESARKAELTVREVYQRWGRGSDFVTDFFPGGHEIHGVEAYPFILSHF